MTDIVIRVALSFLFTALLFLSVLFVLLLLDRAPVLLLWGVLFGVSWAANFSMIHVRKAR
jgi:hypothetical protein